MASLFRSLAIMLSLAIFPTSCSWAQGKPAPEELTGLKIGQTAPRFVLKDQEGKERSLSDFLNQGKVALVFYRSADW